MHDFLREADPTRLVHYEGVFQWRASEAASDIESQMYTRPAQVEEYALSEPEEAIYSLRIQPCDGQFLRRPSSLYGAV